nr:hypothetical protein [Novosphingobium sp. NDB2Meth1]
MIGGEGLGIAFGLALGLHHRLGPARGAPPRCAALDSRARGLAEQVEVVFAFGCRRPIALAALLGLKNEAAAFVAVDPAEALRAVAVILEHAAFEYIVVVLVVGTAPGRSIDAEQVAQTVDEALRVGEFATAGFTPMRDECINVGGVSHASLVKHRGGERATKRIGPARGELARISH